MAKHPQKKEPSPTRREANKFDKKIVKENLEPLLPVILNKIIRLEPDCEIKNAPALKLQVTIEKEPAFLKFIKRRGNRKRKMLHSEFETKDDPKTDRPLAFYNTLILLVHDLESEQHVIYLLPGKPKNVTGAVHNESLSANSKVHPHHQFQLPGVHRVRHAGRSVVRRTG